MIRLFLRALGAIAAVLASSLVPGVPALARAGTYRFVEADGAVHYTNAPTDPRYERLGFTRPSPPAAAVAASDRGAAFVPLIRDAAQRHGVPERLVHAVIRAESAFNPWAVSRKGARGLMQLMPGTASLLGVRDSFDPAQNIDGGVRHLGRLIERFGHDIALALAAYNAGEQAVTQYRGIPPYPETLGYVEKVLTFYSPAVDSTKFDIDAGKRPESDPSTSPSVGTIERAAVDASTNGRAGGATQGGAADPSRNDRSPGAIQRAAVRPGTPRSVPRHARGTRDAVAAPQTVYRATDAEGTAVYTNVPPAGLTAWKESRVDASASPIVSAGPSTVRGSAPGGPR